tara:strand:- start:2974 stop:4008 length:1035 start_codon:yes stop_codon:yes gene_type:complete
MKTYKLAIIGFGNVGQGLTKIIKDKRALLNENFGIDLIIVAVCDLYKGSIANSKGLDPELLLSNLKEHGDLKSIQAPIKGWNAIETINNSGADILVELSYTDLKTGEPALSHVKQALHNGMHVSMTNKGPVALHYSELRQLALDKNVQIGIEGTVMSGTPSINLGSEMLIAAGITKIQGIFNGTTNYILDQMSTGVEYKEALLKAQELGYAEADPTGDVEGHDAAAKVVILGNLLMGLSLSLNDIDRIGIVQITNADIDQAKDKNKHWKLIGMVKNTNNGYVASVKPEMLSNEHPLSSIRGATNAITYSTELLGDVTLVGPGAGRIETGFAVIEDILSIHRKNI